MDIIGKRYLYFGISMLVIIPGLIALAIWGLPLAIDFTGGSLLEVQFNSGVAPQDAQVITLYDQLGILQPQVQSSGSNTLIIRSKEITNEQKNTILADLSKQFNSQLTVLQFETVGPSIGQEVASRAAAAVGIAALGILIYITFAFRGVPHAFRFGTAAIVAMLHDVAVVIGTAAIFGHFLGWEVDSLYLTALLTVIGFSVHDTIVVFDRIRENANIFRRVPFEEVVNHSIVQTLDRSINTQLTVMFTLAALALLGGITIQHFVVTLLIGVFSGTYSSIFNASPILVVWENKEWRYWFKGNWKKPSTLTTTGA
ncbi:MAG: protein translocase subunit SecF [Chloroflexi bacterium]|nr:protein translocase subunit SecF [Chloroflexota bacterium]